MNREKFPISSTFVNYFCSSVIDHISGVGKICLRIIQKFYFIQINPKKDVQTSLILGRRFLLAKNIFVSEWRITLLKDALKSQLNW